MKFSIIFVTAFTFLVACGGSKSNSIKKESVAFPLNTNPVISGPQRTVLIDSSSFDYIAIKESNGIWKQLPPKIINKFILADGKFELAFLCIENGQKDQYHFFNHFIYDLSFTSSEPEININSSCQFPREKNKVIIASATSNVELLRVADDNFNDYFLKLVSGQQQIEVITSKGRTNFDLISIGNNVKTKKMYMQRITDLNLQDGETHSVSFYDDNSDVVSFYSPNKGNSFFYEAEYISQSGLKINTNINSERFFLVPDKLRKANDGYLENWQYNSNEGSLSYERFSNNANGKTRISSAITPFSKNEISVDKASMAVSFPNTRPYFDNLTNRNVSFNLTPSYTLLDNYSYFHNSIGIHSTNDLITLKAIDFNSLPGFTHTAVSNPFESNALLTATIYDFIGPSLAYPLERVSYFQQIRLPF